MTRWPRSRAPTASPSCTPTSRTGWSSPATAARCSSASARRRCTSPPTSPRSSGTPRPSPTSATARSPRSPPAASRRTAGTCARSPGPRRPSTSTRRRTRPASTSPSCTRRCSSSRPRRARVLGGRLDERFGTAHLGGLNMDARETRAIRRVKILGCGSAYYVGQMGAALVEELARIPADAEAASEFRYRDPVIEADTLYVAVSQSGETIDTLLAVQEIRRKGGRVDRPRQRRRQRDRPRVRRRHLPARRARGRRRVDEGADQHVPRVRAARAAARPRARPVDRRRPAPDRRADPDPRADPGDPRAGAPRSPRSPTQLAEAESLFFIGRVRGFPVAREGAQKFKEISYRHAEAYQTSELKHGPLALVSEQVPTVAIVPDDELDRPQRRRPARDRRASRSAGRDHPRGRRPRRGRLRAHRRAPQRARARPGAARRTPAAAGLPRRASSSATTSTSRATSPSRSPSSSADRGRVTQPTATTKVSTVRESTTVDG